MDAVATHHDVTGSSTGILVTRFGMWKPGQSGNPKGRPKGARSKLSEIFLQEFLDVWTVEGKAALERMAREFPEKFVTFAITYADVLAGQSQTTEGPSVTVKPLAPSSADTDNHETE
jgi:hypothetical protein